MQQHYYVYVLRSFKDKQFYVGFTKNLPARVEAHNKGLVPSTRNRLPLQLVYWEGCLNQTDATHREKYLKTAWGKRYVKTRLRNYLTGKRRQHHDDLHTCAKPRRQGRSQSGG